MKIAYYSVIKGRGYWRPTRAMRGFGFEIVRCGTDGPAAWAIAKAWTDRWTRARRGEIGAASAATLPARATPETAEAAIIYPRGSLGGAFRRYRETEEWAKKGARTREDWWRGWKRIRPIFGDVAPATVDLKQISAWRAAIEASKGRREAHRAMKIWRALWKVAAALRYCERTADPSLGVINRAARGRSATWSEGEAVRLVKGAWRAGYCGLAAALAVMWDSQLSPGDVRLLTAGQLAATRQGRAFVTERAKTEVPVGAILSRRTSALLKAYRASLGYELLPDAILFRSRGLPQATPRGGRPQPGTRYTKDILTKEFRIVRGLVFGPAETRQMMDFRRSGAVEAISGGAKPEHLSHALGNTLSASNALYKTYVPVNVTTLEHVQAARKKGRTKMRGG